MVSDGVLTVASFYAYSRFASHKSYITTAIVASSLNRMARTFVSLTIVLAAVLSALPVVAAQSSYNWTLTCKGGVGGITAGSAARWNWTQNGVSIAGSYSFCTTYANQKLSVSGTGTVPANANGIVVLLYVHAKNCFSSTSTTRPFTTGVSISLKASCTGNAYGTPVPITGTFDLNF